MDKDTRKKDNRAKDRAHRGGRGRGGGNRGRGRGGVRVKDQPLPPQPDVAQPRTECQWVKDRRKQTTEACLSRFYALQTPPEYAFSEEESARLSAVLSRLSAEDQIAGDYIVPVPPFDHAAATQKRAEPPEPAEAPKPAETPKPAPAEQNLDAWLNGLLQ